MIQVTGQEIKGFAIVRKSLLHFPFHYTNPNSLLSQILFTPAGYFDREPVAYRI